MNKKNKTKNLIIKKDIKSEIYSDKSPDKIITEPKLIRTVKFNDKVGIYTKIFFFLY